MNIRTESQAAVVVDWDNWWAVEYSAGPGKDLRYLDEAIQYYSALHAKNVSVDILSGCSYQAGDVLKMDVYGVAILESEKL